MTASARTWRPGRPVDLVGTCSVLVRGSGDASGRLLARTGQGPQLWRATWTPAGSALLHVRCDNAAGEVLGRAWGAGREWVLDGLPELLGVRDDDEDLGHPAFRPRPEHPALVAAWRARPAWRLGRSRAVFEALSGVAFEQVVTGLEARRSLRTLVRRYGEPAPGPAAAAGGEVEGLLVPPTPAVWAQVPTWEWLRAGVEGRRSAVVVRAAGVSGRLEATLGGDHASAGRAMRSLAGVGRWTVAEVMQRAHGDPDAFSFDDYHVAKNVSWALTGEVLDDDGCAEVIACYTGHRYRVQRLLELAGTVRPRRGPKMTLPTHTPSATSGRS